MIKLVVMAIGIGLFINLLLGELFGLIAGGMVVAGYFALNLDMPLDIALTLLAALITLAVVRGLSRVVILYGRRMFAATVLVGYLVGMGLNQLLWRWGPAAAVGENWAIPPGDVWGFYRTVGFILPGLIALWMDRQGIFETVCGLLFGAAVVRIVLMLVVGSEIGPVTEVYFGPVGAQP